MVSPLTRKYIDHFRIVFKLLNQDESPETAKAREELLSYIRDLDRFSAPKTFEKNMASLLEAKGFSGATGVDSDSGLESTDEAAPVFEQYETINTLLEQCLNILEQGVTSSQSSAGDLRNIVQKIKEAKSINNMRILSEVIIKAGNDLVNSSLSFQNDLGQMALEVGHMKKRISELEGELKSTKKETQVDHLTGLLNRRAFDNDIQEALTQASRFNNPVSLLLMDVDHFKSTNDTWGHKVGDDVLVNFSQLVKSSLRKFDLTYRMGGDEFAVIFNGCKPSMALQIAERLRKYVADHTYRVGELRFNLTISGGITLFREGESRVSLYERADKLLYKAKQNKRNQICTDIVMEEEE